MAECPRFPIVPVYRTPPPPNASFPLPPGRPIFGPMPAHFAAYLRPPVAWPVHHLPPTPPGYGHSEDEQDAAPLHHFQFSPPPPQPMPVYFNGNGVPMMPADFPTCNDARQTFQHGLPPRPPMMHSRVVTSSKFDTKHEEFRKYLEENGILSTFTNVLAEMYQDPLRPKDSLEYIREKLSCSKPETVELSNLRRWCKQYQTKTERLEKELKYVIERLRNHEPYDSDDSFINDGPSVNTCKSCESEVSKQEHVLRKMEENGNYESFINNNQ